MFFSPTIAGKYAGTSWSTGHFYRQAVHSMPASERWYIGARTGEFAPRGEAGYLYYLRNAMVRELTREREYPADFAADAYEWLSDCEVTRTTQPDMPDWYYAVIVDKQYEGGLAAFLADKAAWEESEDINMAWIEHNRTMPSIIRQDKRMLG